MTKTHKVIQVINGIPYVCQDIGCEDCDKAAENRRMVKENLFTTAYDEVEKALQGTPLGQRLPKWIPLGDLPVVSLDELEQLCGDGWTMLDELAGDLTDPPDGGV